MVVKNKEDSFNFLNVVQWAMFWGNMQFWASFKIYVINDFSALAVCLIETSRTILLVYKLVLIVVLSCLCDVCVLYVICMLVFWFWCVGFLFM